MANKQLTGYELSRQWFDFSFENPELIKPVHTAVYFFAIEHNNRLGWRKRFGFPTTMVMEAIGVKSYNTYINALRDLVSFGFIEMIEQSKNQHSANIIALSKYNKALDGSLDKAFIKHTSKQSESTGQSIDSIDKPLTKEPLTKEQIEANKLSLLSKREIKFKEDVKKHNYETETLKAFFLYWSEPNKQKTKMKFEMQQTFDIGRRLKTWSDREKNFSKSKSNDPNADYEPTEKAKNDPNRLEL